MKLRNKKTGEIIERYIIETASAIGAGLILQDNDTNKHYQYNSLAELNEEWEDYEEPKDIWWLDNEGYVNHATDIDDDYFEKNREIGNYFVTKEEAEKAVEKLRAWRRLKDRGFKFKGYNAQAFGEIKFSIEDDWEDSNFDHLQHKADLDLLFGGEE